MGRKQGNKRFKEIEKMFSSTDIRHCREQWYLDDLAELPFWAHGYDQPNVETAKHACYWADKWEDWQLFRCALKGLTTGQKLAMLQARWSEYVVAQSRGADQAVLERQRINNYLGALRRGGQLDAQLQVVR